MYYVLPIHLEHFTVLIGTKLLEKLFVREMDVNRMTRFAIRSIL